MKFTYRAYDQEGKIVSGSIDAIHEQEVLDKLGAKDLLVVGMKKDDGTTTPVANKKGLKVPLGAMCAFTRQLSTMLRAGLPLVRCLESMSRNTNHRNLGLVLRDLAADVQNGDSLSDSLARHPQAFSSVFVAMVRAGEDGGILPDVLDRLASYLEMSLRLRSRIRSAMTYPIIVSTMGIGICIFMVTMIIPVFVDIFKEFDKALPLPTQILISSSSWIRGHLLWCIGGVAVVGFGLRHWRRTPGGTLIWDTLKLRLPVFGPLAAKVAYARFARTIASLLHSGVPVLRTLEITAKAVGNVTVEKAVTNTGQLIEKGATMSEAMSRQSMFPNMMLEMVAVGEETGEVDEMLLQVADHYDREVETTLAALTSLLEPLLILFLGIVVGSIVVAMFLPIFRMTEAVQF